MIVLVSLMGIEVVLFVFVVVLIVIVFLGNLVGVVVV